MSAPDPMLLKAINTHQSGRTAEAKVMYERILRRRPHDADALNFLGMLEFQRGERARGIKLLQRSVQSLPANPHSWLNLGNMMMAVDEAEAGADAYRHATDLAPDLWQAWFNRGTCLRRLRRFEEAMDCLKTAISLKPGHDAAYEKLGMILYRGGKTEELVKLYRGWVEYNPDNPTARHMYAAVMGDQMPDRASDDYVRTAFDNFAESFDDNLRDLQYRAPQLLADALARHNRPLDDAAKKPDILDAGAGTGLCGPLLRERAGTLVGVDLSPGMLKLARDRRLYDELVVGELCAFMRSRPAAFDIVLSADTLVYFGALEEALAAAATCLRPGGLLAFTVERLETTDPAATFTMGVHGRYLHTRDYLRTALAAARFETHEIAPVVLRTELGADVHGYAVVASAS
jgi:predicted TPR repeat methyltransferase